MRVAHGTRAAAWLSPPERRSPGRLSGAFAGSEEKGGADEEVSVMFISCDAFRGALKCFLYTFVLDLPQKSL